MPSSGESVKRGSCPGSSQQPFVLALTTTLTKVSGSQTQTSKQASQRRHESQRGILGRKGVRVGAGEVTLTKTHYKYVCKTLQGH